MIAADLVRAALDKPGGRWFEGLGAPLAATRWRELADSTGLDRGSYGTARHLAGDVAAPRAESGRLVLPAAFDAPDPVIVETLDGAARRRYEAVGLDFHDDADPPVDLVAARFRAAFDRIGRVPAAATAVGALLAALHVVRPHGPDYDVSYSDPDLPFSIFVGVTDAMQPNGDLRLAEGVLHECMHLQLTLVERVVPIVGGTADRLHSPWQGTERPVQGILHGLYVFRVVQDFCRALLGLGGLSGRERAFLEGRVGRIEAEARSIGDLTGARDLTAAGRRLANRLLAA